MLVDQVMQGRRLTSVELGEIGDLLAAHPDWHRTRVSRELCQRWDWRNGVGRLKDMACRSLLLKLEARGLIRLPARRAASVNRWRNREAGAIECEEPVRGPLEGLQPLTLRPVESQEELALFRFLLSRHHYLGYRNTVGENVKYLVRAADGRPLGALLFGAAAWQCAARDTWIGWTAEQRRQRLLLMANNARFLLAPWVRVPMLASHALGLVAGRLSADWERKYGHRIELVESFVDGQRFRGTCYRAAGWQHVGTTTGRTRNGDRSREPGPGKEIFLKPLSAGWKGRLAG